MSWHLMTLLCMQQFAFDNVAARTPFHAVTCVYARDCVGVCTYVCFHVHVEPDVVAIATIVAQDIDFLVLTA
jgi:hypothetical protein